MTECDQAHNTTFRILVDLSINVVFHIDIDCNNNNIGYIFYLTMENSFKIYIYFFLP